MAASIVGLGVAVVAMWSDRRDVQSPTLAALALVLLAVAAVLLWEGTTARRAPLPAKRAVSVVVLGNASIVIDDLAVWGAPPHLADDGGAIALALLILGLASYRPPIELAAMGSLSAILVGFLTVVGAPARTEGGSLTVAIVAGVLPVLLATVGGSVAASQLIVGVLSWRRQMQAAADEAGESATDWIARSVQQDRVTILNRDVVPFFTRVLERGRVDEEDIDEARGIADAIRSSVVRDVDRTWLHIVVERARSSASGRALPAATVSDPSRLAERLSIDERSVLRASLMALLSHPALDPEDVRIVVAPFDDRARLTLTARLDAPDRRIRGDLGPYHAALRVVFPDLAVTFERPLLTLRFSYAR
jgi:hypothetical protein